MNEPAELGGHALSSDGRHRRRGKTRQKLVAAAKTVMANAPAEAVTIDQITQSANVGRGSFYNHFSSMDDLFASTLEDLISDIGHSFAAGRRAFDDIADFAAWSIQFLVQRAVDDPQLGWFIANNVKSQPLLKAHIDPRARAAVIHGAQEGRFQLPDPELWLSIGMASTTAFIRGCLEGRFVVTQSVDLAASILQAAGLSRSEAKQIARRCDPTKVGGALGTHRTKTRE